LGILALSNCVFADLFSIWLLCIAHAFLFLFQFSQYWVFKRRIFYYFQKRNLRYYTKRILSKNLIISNPNTAFETILKSIQKEEISFPIIVKPDVGLRGTAVKKIETEQELKNTLSSISYPFLIQELVPYSNEIGLFYVKLPNENQGKITGIVSKEFLTVIGNGKNTIQELLLKNPRFAFQLETLAKDQQN
jgi:hypothetical protein